MNLFNELINFKEIKLFAEYSLEICVRWKAISEHACQDFSTERYEKNLWMPLGVVFD